MPQVRGVDWGIVSTLVAADTPGLSVKKVETTGACKDKEGIAEEGWAVVRASRKSAVPLREGQEGGCSNLGM